MVAPSRLNSRFERQLPRPGDRRTHRTEKRVPRENASHTARSYVTHRAYPGDCGDCQQSTASPADEPCGSFRFRNVFSVANHRCRHDYANAAQPGEGCVGDICRVCGS